MMFMQGEKQTKGAKNMKKVEFEAVKIGCFYYAGLGRKTLITGDPNQPKKLVSERVKVIAKANGKITAESISDMRPKITVEVDSVTQV